MKSLRRAKLLAGAALIACVGAHAELARWVQDLASPSRLQAVFFRSVALPAGPVEIRRPPNETRAELAKLIAATPSAADLYSLRAREDEQQLDFAAAENDWKQYAQLASDKPAATLALADFYHRRLRPQDEIAALEIVARAPAAASEKFTPPAQQQSWRAFERIETLISAQALAPDLAVTEYRAWIARYPSEPSLYTRLLAFLEERKQFAQAEKAIADYRAAFPNDAVFPQQATASLALKRGSLEEALRVYDRGFRPLWPPELIGGYFDLLKQTHTLRRYLEQARARIAQDPTDLAAAARIYYYYQQQGDLAHAARSLEEYRRRKQTRQSPWTADELATLAQLFEGVHDYDEAARGYYQLYSLASAADADREKALAGIANLLLSAPEQPIAFGSGNLSLYRDIGAMDSGPGFLNGILSLILNGTSPRTEYATEDQASLAYFHRARASELITLFDTRFPNSTERPTLHARLIEAYAVYGDNNAVIRAGGAWIASFPKAAERATVTLAMADAYARQDKVKEEFALYDDLLKEFAARAEGMPLGEAAAAPPQAEPTEEVAAPTFRVRVLPTFNLNPDANVNEKSAAARSPEYARILDRHISRLVALKRIPAALALYRREIDRNPADPGLYERLAAFLDQNKMGAEVEQVYRRAMAQFPDRAWSHKLARWYLRRKQTAQFDQLTREVAAIFSGADLETYLRESTRGQPLAPMLYRQVNLYAHRRFPRDLTFVRNLLTAYTRKGTADPIARETLLRSYWFYDAGLRDNFFEVLSHTNKLTTELTALRLTHTNPAAVQFLAEGEAWQSHFEASAPLFRLLANQYPGEASLNARAGSLYRSLASYDAPADLRNTAVAVSLEDNLARFDPRDTSILARIGEIYADRELYTRARPFWNRIAAVEPGSANGYLEAASVFWDYYRFDDALRLIDEGRRKLGRATLYAYEAGAIHENRREYARALEEYAAAALSGGDSPARSRLLELAQRPQFRARLDELTGPPASSPDAAVPALTLRASVLLAEGRREDLRAFLIAATGRAGARDVLEYIDTTAAARGFADAQERAKLRQVAIATDPVDRMQSQLALAKFYEGRNDLDHASRAMDDLYKNNPAILGVVRSTVDFYSRNHKTKRAVDVLVESARRAQPTYRDPFTLEAALKASDAGDFKTARVLLSDLLTRDLFEPRYLAAMADTYARQSDDRGLREFYTASMQALRQSTLAESDKVERIATLRRGLVPVLTRLKDYSGAVDQYIELINRYPEDDDLTREAAAYAVARGRAQQLTAYYKKASSDSPRDFRWPMTEARIDTQLENFPEAVAAYARAIRIRPDRIDLYAASAALSERLLRFDEAAAAYAKLYELNYHNSQWMEKLALIRARQGQTEAAVVALRTAFLEHRTPHADDYFNIAARLESWDMLPQARGFAEQGLKLAGAEALSGSGAGAYVRVMTRLRQHQVAYRTLLDLARGQEPGAIQSGMNAALREMGAAVKFYFTPEEKSAFAKFLAGDGSSSSPRRERALLVAAQFAGLTDLEAAWRADLLIAGKDAGQLEPLIELQKRRLRLDELGGQLEAYWKALPPDTANRDTWLDQSAMYYRQAGSYNSELRVLGLKAAQSSLNGPNLERYAQLLFERTPQRVEAVASSDTSDEIRNAVADAAVRRGAAPLALTIVAARGRGLPPVWTRAYTGLVGLYFAIPAPQVNAAFVEALASSATIGERLGKPVDRNRQLAGDVWFYYGSRYGEYLAAIHQGDAQDYLPAMLEQSPGRANAYFELGEYYREAGDSGLAAEQYRAALQLDPASAEAHDKLAVVLWTRNRHDEALAEWRAALDALSRRQDTRRVPETFWPGLSSTLQDIGHYHALSSLRPEADRILRTYIQRNGSYRADTLLNAAIDAAGNDGAGVAWIVDLAKAAPDRGAFLNYLANQDWIIDDQRPVVLRAAIEAWRAGLGAPEGESSYREMAQAELTRSRIELAKWLLKAHRAAEARAALTEISDEQYKTHQHKLVSLDVRIAAQSGSLRALLDRYSADRAKAPTFEMLRDAANELRAEGDDASSSTILEYLYTRQLAERDLAAPTFLGLAEIRLKRNDVAGALALLRRLNLVAGEPFENLVASADLLVRSGHPAEASEFLKQRVQAVPWDADARVALGRALLASHNEHDQAVAALKAAALSTEAPYPARAAAASALGEAKAGTVSEPGAELNWLSTASASPTGAEKPYFYFARLRAASQTSDPAVKFRLLQSAVSMNPEPATTRLDLVRAALEARRYNTATAASGFTPPAESDVEARQSESFLGFPEPPLTRAERAALARGLADAYEKIGQPPAALALYRIAERLDHASPEATRQIDRLRADMERERANQQRRPVITPNLEQDHAVRPRLVAAGGPR